MDSANFSSSCKATVPPEYIRTESDREAIAADCYWDERPLNHFLKVTGLFSDPMNPDRRYAPFDWQLNDVLRPLFCWRRADGRRRFNWVHLWVPKKNGKTSLEAAIGLYMFLGDGERRPGCYNVATSGKQSEEIYVEACALLRGSLWQRIVDVQDYRRRILCRANGGVYAAIEASPKSAEGLKGSFVAIDEVHAALDRNPKLFSAMRYAGSGRRQPLGLLTSTAGDDREALPYKLYTRGKAILAGEITDTRTLPVIYEADDKDEYTADEMKAANPSVGQLLDLDQLLQDYAEARTDDHSLEDFKRYRLNVWTKRSTAWLDVNKWLACCEVGFRRFQLDGRLCFAGVDLSSVLDLTAACLVFPLDDGRFFFLQHFWLPKKDIDRRRQREMDYLAAERSGHITLIDGPIVDYSYVAAWLQGWRDRAKLQCVGFDPWRAAELAKSLEGDGFDCVQVKQGWGLSEPSNRFESLIETQDAVHDGNAVMSWCLENVEVRTDNNGKIRPVKPKDKTRRIDGIIAAVMSLYLAMFADITVPPSDDDMRRQMDMINRLYNGTT